MATSVASTTSTPTATTPESSPTSTNSATPAGAATLTLDGLGDLQIGQKVPEDTKLVEWGDFCGFGTSQWHAPGATRDDLGDVSVRTASWAIDGELQDIWVWSPGISTAEGIHVGSSRAALESAYAELEEKPDGNDGAGTTSIYTIRGDESTMVFEVLNPGSKISASSTAEPDTIIWMYLQTADQEIRTLDGMALPGSCG
ncbi:hypothetical protein QT381_15520 [Galbitalea sp. SE-J8]|uniref:hypothetical protein n=1 Tax=Galbitalea sp. SE-J8 TaxID=3054952 RepID=UPI00259C8D70|nr:hypothetical protein [Galbitalea sp. SE-J8]MDM4764409.1 hypothetical protein [Galbitalea sp. SE-J8]